MTAMGSKLRPIQGLDPNMLVQMYYRQKQQEEAWEREDMLRKLATRSMSQQQPAVPQWQQNPKVSGREGGPADPSNWSEGVRKQAADLGVPVEFLLSQVKGYGRGGGGGITGTGQVTTQGFDNEAANISTGATGGEAMRSIQRGVEEEKFGRDVEMQELKGEQRLEEAKVGLPYRQSQLHSAKLSNTRTILNNLEKRKTDITIAMSDGSMDPKQRKVLQNELENVEGKISTATQDYQESLAGINIAMSGQTETPTPTKKESNLGKGYLKKDSPIDTGKMVDTMVVVGGEPMSVSVPEDIQGLDQDRISLAHMIVQERGGDWGNFTKNDYYSLSQLSATDLNDLLSLYEQLPR